MYVRKLYNQEPEAVRASWSHLGKRCRSESQRATPAKMRKKCCYVQKNLGQYVAVCLRLQLTSHIQPTSTLSDKVWEVYFYTEVCERFYFYKEVCSFVHWSRHYCWLCFCIYMYTSSCITAIQHKVNVTSPLDSGLCPTQDTSLKRGYTCTSVGWCSIF